MKKLNKAKKSGGELLAVNELFDRGPTKVKNYGVWLRYESRLTGPGVYYIEKGGRRQHQLSCNTGRFDLSLFVGREVGVIGPRRRPIAALLSVLDVERIEVLGAMRR